MSRDAQQQVIERRDMSNEGMADEINKAIDESIEESKLKTPAEGSIDEGEHSASIVGDMDIKWGANEDDIEDRIRDNEDDKEGEENEESKEANELSSKPKENESDVVSDETVSDAVSHGIMSVSEARSFGSDARLRHTIDIVKEQNRLVLAEDANRVSGNQEDENGLLELPKLDPEKYDKEIIEIFEALKNEVNKGRTERLELQTNQQTENLASQQAASAALGRWFDMKCSDLGDGFKDSIGVGNTDLLGLGSKELTTRESIAEHMGVMHDGYVAQGREAPSIDELFDSATKSVLSKEFKATDKAALKGKLEKRSGQMLNRVGRSSGSEKLTAEQETANMLIEKFDM